MPMILPGATKAPTRSRKSAKHHQIDIMLERGWILPATAEALRKERAAIVKEIFRDAIEDAAWSKSKTDA